MSDYKYQHEWHTLDDWSSESVVMSLPTLDNRYWSYWIEVQSLEIVCEVISSSYRTLLNCRTDQEIDYNLTEGDNAETKEEISWLTDPHETSPEQDVSPWIRLVAQMGPENPANSIDALLSIILSLSLV